MRHSSGDWHHSLGTEEGTRLIESLEGIEALFIARDRTVTMTSGAEEYLIQ